MRNRVQSIAFFLFLVLLSVGITAWGMQSGEAAPPDPPGAAVTMPTPESWLVLPTLSASATQADVGSQVYILVCRACHGDRGQGLTEEWRASWDPADRNCWQSKCHAANHPPEGFEFPRWAPQVMGQGAMARFQTAEDLHAFLKERMPWYAPGSLTDQEYWQLTAYLARENHFYDGQTVLTADNAANIRFWPAQTAVTAQHPASNGSGQPWAALAVALLATACAALLVAASFLRRRRLSQRP